MAGGKRRVYACGDGLVWYSGDGGGSWHHDQGVPNGPFQGEILLTGSAN